MLHQVAQQQPLDTLAEDSKAYIEETKAIEH